MRQITVEVGDEAYELLERLGRQHNLATHHYAGHLLERSLAFGLAAPPAEAVIGCIAALVEGGPKPTQAARRYMPLVFKLLEEYRPIDDKSARAHWQRSAPVHWWTDMHLEMVPIRSVLDKVAAMTEDSVYWRSGHRLALDIYPDCPLYVVADANAFEMILDNLVGNALKFSPEGGEVRVSAAPQNDAVAFTITDEGIGMPADYLPRYGEKFAREEGAGINGAGIGAFLARRFVEAQGGTLTAASDGPGHGSRVIFTLPAPADRVDPEDPEFQAALAQLESGAIAFQTGVAALLAYGQECAPQRSLAVTELARDRIRAMAQAAEAQLPPT